jgi:hypothetical protein
LAIASAHDVPRGAIDADFVDEAFACERRATRPSPVPANAPWLVGGANRASERRVTTLKRIMVGGALGVVLVAAPPLLAGDGQGRLLSVGNPRRSF